MSSFSGYALVLSAVLLVVAAEAPAYNQHLRNQQNRQAPVPFLSQRTERDHAGQYSLQFSAANGIQVSEQGSLKLNEDKKDHVLVKKGTYAYTSPEGVPVRVSYYADETGFHPVSDSLPLTPAELAKRHRH